MSKFKLPKLTLPKLKKRTVIFSASSVAALALATTGFVISVNQPITVDRPVIFTEQNVGMQMFGWNWNSLKTECATSIGPAGIDWILVDPPTDHIKGPQWWIHYQPTNYDIVGDHGNREQFKAMVEACKAAGVQVLADAVLNHMANGIGISFGGKPYGMNLKYADLYTKKNFHEGLDRNDPNYCIGDIQNWDEFVERTNCRFPGLPDLATEQTYVRQTIASYLNDLLSLGVAGFRLDAAKHMKPQDIAAIYNLLDSPAYLVQEVPGDRDTNADYLPNGDVWNWQSASDLASMFAYASKMETEAIGWSEFQESQYPSDQAVTWVSNHDTERDGGSLTYKDKEAFELASLYLLSQPYGKPMLFSGYRFPSRDIGVPQNENGLIVDAVCGTEMFEFTCYQRLTSIAGMISWRKEMHGNALSIEDGKNGVYAQNRSGAGLFVLNYNKKPAQLEKQTDLPDGSYCDLVSGGKTPISSGSCVGDQIEVVGGQVKLNMKPLSAQAISLATKLN